LHPSITEKGSGRIRSLAHAHYAFWDLWRLHIVPPQQSFFASVFLAIWRQQSAPASQHSAPSLQHPALEAVSLAQQEAPSLQHAAPDLQQDFDSVSLPMQHATPFWQQVLPFLQQAAWVGLDGFSGVAGAAF
jgi:hypothetical protein